MKEPKVSIIVPCYNAAKTVAETLESIQQQTLADWEAIVVDDGSTDDSADIINRYATNDERIRYVKQQNQGLASARNMGLQHAQGEFVNFLDADDLLLPEMLARTTLAFVDERESSVAYCSAILADESLVDMTATYEPVVEEFPFRELAAENALPCHCLVLRRDLFSRVGEFDRSLKHCHDWDMWLRIARLGVRFVRVPQALVVYRMRPASMSRRGITFFEAGRTVIRRGHGPDPRVSDVSAEYADGCETSGSEQVAQWAVHTACIAIAQGESAEACAMLEEADRELPEGLLPEHFAGREHSLFYGAALTPINVTELWSRVGRNVIETLLQIETRLGRHGLAMEALLHLRGVPGQIRQIAEQQGKIARQQTELDSIYQSYTWRVASKLHRLIDLVRLPFVATPKQENGSHRTRPMVSRFVSEYE